MTPDKARCQVVEARIASLSGGLQMVVGGGKRNYLYCYHYGRRRCFCECSKVPSDQHRSLRRVLVMATSSQHSSCMICLTAGKCLTVLCSHAVTWHLLVCSRLSIVVGRAPHVTVMVSHPDCIAAKTVGMQISHCSRADTHILPKLLIVQEPTSLTTSLTSHDASNANK